MQVQISYTSERVLRGEGILVPGHFRNWYGKIEVGRPTFEIGLVFFSAVCHPCQS